MACQNYRWKVMGIARYLGFFPLKENLYAILLFTHYLTLLLHVPSFYCLMSVKNLLNSFEL